MRAGQSHSERADCQLICTPNRNDVKRERKLTLAQCAVGGFFGFGLFAGIFCYASASGLVRWLILTVFLTTLYTLYYFFSTKPPKGLEEIEAGFDG